MTERRLAFFAVRNPTKTQIGNWLKAARESAREHAMPDKKADFAQAGIANRLGVRERAVRMWEKGRTSPPAHQFLELVWFYGADLSALLPRRSERTVEIDGGVDVPHPTQSDAASERKKKRRPA